MNDISLRFFNQSDLQAVVQLIHQTVRVCYPSCYAQEVVDFFIDYHKEEEIIRKAEEGKLLLAFKCNVLVATGYLIGEEVGGVYVHPDHPNQGVAPVMVNALLKEAKKKGLNSVWLESTPIALKLYQKLGFSIDEECVMYVENDTPLPYYHMVKEIV